MTPALRAVPAAFAFLTRLPVGGFPYTSDELRWSSAHFPLVGAALGATLAGVMLISRHAGSVVAAALAVSVGMLLTGSSADRLALVAAIVLVNKRGWSLFFDVVPSPR